jgi:hypothetical protein
MGERTVHDVNIVALPKKFSCVYTRVRGVVKPSKSGVSSRLFEPFERPRRCDF